MFGLFVRFTCKDEAAAEAFDQLVAETIEAIRDGEPGTLVYASHRSTASRCSGSSTSLPGPGGVRGARGAGAHPTLPGGAGPVPGQHRGRLADSPDRQGNRRVTTEYQKALGRKIARAAPPAWPVPARTGPDGRPVGGLGLPGRARRPQGRPHVGAGSPGRRARRPAGRAGRRGARRGRGHRGTARRGRAAAGPVRGLRPARHAGRPTLPRAQHASQPRPARHGS